MNEQDFKNALRQTMTVQPAPPQMSDAVVLEAAHRDLKRRRAMMAGLGSAAAVAAVIVGVAVIAPAATGSGSGGVGVGGQQTSSSVNQTQISPPPASGTEEAPKSSETLPPGMTDRTSKNGPEFDRGQALAAALDDVVPDGYGAPGDLKGEEELADATLKWSQANLDSNAGGNQEWSYLAITPLTKGTGVGELAVEVVTPRDETSTGAVCDLPAFWGEKGTCEEVTVGGKKVAVVSDTERFDQWAAYRHDDGTVVYVAQSAEYTYSGLPALAAPPLTTEQLAALAVDPRFNLDA